MSETKFTPGPWAYDPPRITAPALREGVGITDVCEIYDSADPDYHAKTKFDGYLIAAAPDLYAACAEFVRKVESGQARSTRSYEQMKAAIAKARGEQ